ncbi:MAG: hypothetical protein ABIJ65_00930, partial [Chloroflexota bacterium]
MRTFETLTAVFLLFSILRYVIPNRPRWLEYLPSLTMVVCLLQINREGYRWQMVPIFVFSFVMFLFTLPSILGHTRKNTMGPGRRIFGLLLALLLFAVAYALPILLPIPKIPNASGHYKVGTFSMMLVDNSRKELYSNNSNDQRRIMVQVWYPAEPLPGDSLAPWMDRADLIGPAISRFLNLPAFFLDHLKYAQTGAYLESPVSNAQTSYPVLLFSHGWNGFRAQNTFQAINFASNGYIVVAIDHTYGAVLTVFPDGSVAYNNPD